MFGKYIKNCDESAIIKTSEIKYSEELIKSCQMNHCGKYNKSWMCPPAINQQETINEYNQYRNVFVFTKITKLEDPFDIEGMDRGRKEVELILKKFKEEFTEQIDYKILGPGSCSICEKCTYPSSPCRFPHLANPSLESLGINVIDLAKSCKIKYYNGPNTVTYFAAIFYDKEQICLK